MRGLARITALLAAALCAVYADDPSFGTVADLRDGRTYRTVKIGRQTWMAENLNYETDGSWCYGDYDSDNKYWRYGDNNPNCDEYGRLYDWETAKTVCPYGWYLPSRQDWGNLWLAAGGRSFFDGWSVASKKLKTKTAWESYLGKSGNGTDDYGFSALPGGGRYIDGNFYKAGFFGNWWDATDYDTADAYFWRMYHDEKFVQDRTIGKSSGLSVRCVQGTGGGPNRKGAPGSRIYYSNFGFDGAIEDLLFGLKGGGNNKNIEPKNTKRYECTQPIYNSSGLIGGRSRESVQRVLMQNMAAFRYAYNKRLREKPGLSGRINVKFAIDEHGSVIFAQLLESTMNDSALEETIVHKVKSLEFEKIDKPGDVTEVVFPFVFSQ